MTRPKAFGAGAGVAVLAMVVIYAMEFRLNQTGSLSPWLPLSSVYALLFLDVIVLKQDRRSAWLGLGLAAVVMTGLLAYAVFFRREDPLALLLVGAYLPSLLGAGVLWALSVKVLELRYNESQKWRLALAGSLALWVGSSWNSARMQVKNANEIGVELKHENELVHRLNEYLSDHPGQRMSTQTVIEKHMVDDLYTVQGSQILNSFGGELTIWIDDSGMTHLRETEIAGEEACRRLAFFAGQEVQEVFRWANGEEFEWQKQGLCKSGPNVVEISFKAKRKRPVGAVLIERGAASVEADIEKKLAVRIQELLFDTPDLKVSTQMVIERHLADDLYKIVGGKILNSHGSEVMAWTDASGLAHIKQSGVPGQERCWALSYEVAEMLGNVPSWINGQPATLDGPRSRRAFDKAQEKFCKEGQNVVEIAFKGKLWTWGQQLGNRFEKPLHGRPGQGGARSAAP